MKYFISEMIGTYFLVLMGCGSIIVNDLHGGAIGHAGIALSFGLIVMVMIYAIGNISGAHMNPAVTLGFFVAGRISHRELTPYISGQFAGSILAAISLLLAFPDHENLGATIPQIGIGPSFAVEFVMTALLMFVILNVSTGHMEKGIMAGVAVGGVIALEALVAGPLTGASMNPFRSLAPALLSGNLNDIWLYIAAPISGAISSYAGYYYTGKPHCIEKNCKENRVER